MKSDSVIKHMASRIGLLASIVVGVLLALTPVIVYVIDDYYYKLSVNKITVTTTQPAVSENMLILKPEALSNTGCDTLIVSPAEVVVKPGIEFNVTIKVLFKHTQPCPYSDWKVYYNASSGLEIVSDDGGRLVDPKTYLRILTVKAMSNSTLTVVFKYGSGCPYGEEEKVEAKVIVSENPGKVSPSSTNTTASTSIEASYTASNITITGVVKGIDVQHSTIIVGDHVVYVRGEWIASDGRELDRRQLVSEIPLGVNITIIGEPLELGKIKAYKIIVDNVTYTRIEE